VGDGEERPLAVMRGFTPRIYPPRWRTIVGAPRRVGPRVKPAGDEKESVGDSGARPHRHARLHAAHLPAAVADHRRGAARDRPAGDEKES
jgi:hypothetical protein